MLERPKNKLTVYIADHLIRGVFLRNMGKQLLSNSPTSEKTDVALMDEEAVALMLDEALLVHDANGQALACEALFERFSLRNARFHLNFLVFHHFWRQGYDLVFWDRYDDVKLC